MNKNRNFNSQNNNYKMDNKHKTKIEPIIVPSTWYPPNLNPDINTFCNKLKYHVKVINEKYKNTPNLSKYERIALNKLRNNKNIIIKAADKGGGICVMNTSDYTEKMLNHLNSNPAYIKIEGSSYDPKMLLNEYLEIVLKLKCYLSKKQFNWLMEVKNELGIIYGLPKIHKKDIPLRPIISQCCSLTRKLHIYIQQLLKIGEAKIPNIIKDTTDFLNKLHLLKDKISDDTLLVTMDVESLYTNIPLDFGIELLVEHYTRTLRYWNDFEIDVKPIPPKLLKIILEFTLRNCYFTFNNLIYKQIIGLTMGGASSVQEANIIMYKFFERFNHEYPSQVWDHYRFIDDLFGIWSNDENSLKIYFNTLNNYHPNFKFTINYSKLEIPFLDVKVCKINNNLETTLYTKPTDKKLYLNYLSEHTEHIKKSIPFSQMLRLKRIISSESELNFHLDKMTVNFINRKYPLSILTTARNRLTSIDRPILLKYKPKINTSDNLILIQVYNNKLIKNNILKKRLAKLWDSLTIRNPLFKNIWPKYPMIVFKNGKNIKNMLISSKFPAPWQVKPDTFTRDTALDDLNIENLLALMTA